MARVIVTGGTGFIGRQVVARLLAQGATPVVMTMRVDVELPPGAHSIEVDLTDSDAVTAAVAASDCDALIHLAWQPVVRGLWSAPENVAWVRHSLHLAEAFMAAGGKQMVFAGSCGEYDWTGGLCAEEVTPLRPSTLYGGCKLALFAILEPLAREAGVALAWGRAFFVYGPGEHPSRLGASVVGALLDGQPALCSHGMQLRDYLHVADVAEGFVSLLEGGHEGAYNLASGHPIRVRDLIEALAEAAGRPDLVELGAREAPAHEPPLIVADMTKTHSVLDWRPRFDLQSGAQDTVDAFRATLAA